jgi:hypothetical protein
VLPGIGVAFPGLAAGLAGCGNESRPRGRASAAGSVTGPWSPTNSEYARGARYGLAAVCIWAGFIVVATAHPGHAGGAQATDWGAAGEMRTRIWPCSPHQPLAGP